MSNQALLDSLNGTEIAIVGMAGRFPGARNLDEYWRNIRDGVESISFYTDDELRAEGVDESLLRDPNYVPAAGALQDMELFDGAFFGFSPRDASIMDPQHRHFLEVSWEALENAGYDPERFDGAIGVFGGSGHNAYMPYNLLTNPDLLKSVGFFLMRHTGNDKDFLTTRVSYLLNLRGPSVNVQTACSTSLVAIHMAAQSLLNQECDMALAGGVTIEMPHRQGYIYHEGEVLSPDGHCRAFDDASAGTVFGSGVGVVVLRRLEDAINDGDVIHAVLRGSAINNDGSGKMNYLAPSVDGQASAIAEALAIADVPADTISYVETHGTGTRIGDPIEITALTQAFRATTKKKGFAGIGSVKTNIGHLDTAAGVASAIKVVMALKNKQLPPSLNFSKPNALIDFESSPFYVNDKLRDWSPPKAGLPRRAGVSSLGVGGTNAHIVLEEAPELEPSSDSRQWQLLMLSARTNTALEGNTQRLIDYLKEHPEQNLADVAYTLQLGRQPMNMRRVIAVRDAEDAITALEARDGKRMFTQKSGENNTKVAFMFPGGGAQYPNMGRELYENEPAYRDAVDECLRLLQPELNFELKSVMFPADEDLEQATEILERRVEAALPALFITEYATAKQWMAWGIQPETFIGHSLGEYTAAHLAGVMSLKDALSIVTLRGRLFDSLPEGGMLSILRPEAEIVPLLVEGAGIAVVNSPSACVVSGSIQAIEAMQQVLDTQGIEYRRLRISAPAHSAVLDPILDDFHKGISKVKFKQPTTPYITNLTGTWATEDVADAKYWVRHLRQTVRFAEGIATLMQDPNRVLLECGPGNTLSTLARQHPDKLAALVVLSSLRHPRETDGDYQYMLTTLGRLWMNGQMPDWSAFYINERRCRVPLPTYAFDHQRFWIEPGKASFAGAQPGQTSRQTLAKMPNLEDWFYRPVWKPTPLPSNGAAHEKQRWMVFMDDTGLSAQIITLLEREGHEIIRIDVSGEYTKIGDRHYSIDPTTREDYIDLIEDLIENNLIPHKIVHAYGVTTREMKTWHDNYEKMRDWVFYSLLFLAQTLGSEQIDQPIHIGVLTNGMQKVADEKLPYPEKAVAIGPVKVIPREYPGIFTSQSIDVVLPQVGLLDRWLKSDSMLPLAQDVLHEMFAQSSDAVVAYRAGTRYIQDYENSSVPQNQPQLREGGVYLITGGLGGIGLVHAEYLARTVKAKLVLLGRSAFPAREDWERWLMTHTEHDKVSRQIRQVQHLEELGAEVLFIRADVGSRAQLQHAVEEALERFGAIHGVIHAAGVIADGAIQMKNIGTVAKVFAPKIVGTIFLDEIFRDKPLDFFVVFSSTSTILGSGGQIDYTSANAFLDAFANSKGRGTYAINWGVWQEVGMAVNVAAEMAEGNNDEPQGIPMRHPLLGKLIVDAPNEVVYSSEYTVKHKWILDQHRLKTGQALIPGTGYLELAKAALEKDSPRGALEIRDLFFVAPLEVKEDERKEVRIALNKNGRGYHFAVTSKSNYGGDWQQHANGVVEHLSNAEQKVYDIAALLERCNQRVITFGVKEQFTKQEEHLNFGPRWKNLRQINFGQGEALALLELPEEFTGDLEHYTIHPALMDLATGYGLPLVEGYEQSSDFYVPMSYNRVRIYDRVPQRIFSYIYLNGVQRDVVIFDVVIMDEAGHVLVEVDQFMVKRVKDEASFIGADKPGAKSRKIELSGKPSLLQLALTDGIAPAEGVRVFERVIGGGGGSQVIATSMPLPALVDFTNQGSAPAEDDGMKFSRPAGLGDYVEARDKVEESLVKVWQAVLGIEPIGIHDDFFEMGGESLIAVRLFAQLKKLYGVESSLATLFQAPTIAQFADLIREDFIDDQAAGGAAAKPKRTKRVKDLKMLVPIQPSGSKPPFFGIHGAGGNVMVYQKLTNYLGYEQPFYGLQARGVDGISTPLTDIPQMAALYLQEVRQLQPHGPYYLGGFSMGGEVAYEMAQQLLAAGEEVALLVLFDTLNPDRPVRYPNALQSKVSGHMERLNSMSMRERTKYVLDWTTAKANRVRQKAAFKIAQTTGQRLPYTFTEQYLWESNLKAVWNYDIQPYPGPITLIRASETLFENPMEHPMAWGPLAGGGLDAHIVYGVHEILEEPYVEEVAEKFAAILSEAQAKARSRA